jgi:predicted nucleotide-binding protein
MNPEDEKLRERLELLNRIDFQLVEQDTLSQERGKFALASGTEKSVLRDILYEVEELQIQFSTPPLPLIMTVRELRRYGRLARAKVIWERKRIRSLLGLPALPGEGAEEPVAVERSKLISIDQSDPRKVFVVYGRNSDARQAIFDFLTYIGLKPIEWEEAIASTGSMAPSNFTAIERAFATCRAAVIVLTGDDLARLGRRYHGAHEELYDVNLTRQARPNVIFEAGMAFGKMPDRTLIVSFGRTRKFTDIDGVNILYLQDTPQSRQTIADRLRIPGCAVETEHKTDWMKAGNFSAAYHEEKGVDWSGHSELSIIRKHASPEEGTIYQPKVWIDLRNDSDLCMDIVHLGWVETPAGIRIENGFKSMHLKLGAFWCPEKEGIESLHVAPSSTIRAWVQPTAAHNMEDLKRRVKVDGQIGKLQLRVNGRDVDFDI